MSNILTVPEKLYQINDYDGSELSIDGWWNIPKKLFRDKQLPPPISTNLALLILSVKLTVAQDEESWQSDEPFVVELEICTAASELGSRSKPIVRARRPLSIGHVWALKERKSSSLIRLPVPAYGRTFEDFQNELLTSLLAHIIRSPKATLRWDRLGLVASVNVGNTYISTREHSV